MKKFFKKVIYILSLEWLIMSKKEAVDLGLCDYSGQGRDKYGR